MQEWLQALVNAKKVISNSAPTPAKVNADSFEKDDQAEKIDSETPLSLNSSQMNIKSKDTLENLAALQQARIQTTIALQNKIKTGDVNTALAILNIQENALRAGAFGMDNEELNKLFSE